MRMRSLVLCVGLAAAALGVACSDEDSPRTPAFVAPADTQTATATATAAAADTNAPPVASVASPETVSTYTVQAGDTLAAIASVFGVSLGALAQLNGIADANSIEVGMVIQIPDRVALPPGCDSTTASHLALEGSGTGMLMQLPGPFRAYGGGICPDDVVESFVDGARCAAVTADAAGNWTMEIAATAPCDPEPGSLILFSLNGVVSDQAETWSVGGLPADVVMGVSLGE